MASSSAGFFPSCLLVLAFLHAPFAHTDFTNFTFNGFHDSRLMLSGIAAVDSGVIVLTNGSSRSLGRALFPSPVQIKNASSDNFTFSFSATFVFSVVPRYPGLGGHGLAFIMTPRNPVDAYPSQYLGMLNAKNNGNFSNHLFAVEFDTVQDLEFLDINDNHVGVNINSMVSNYSASAAYRAGNSGKQSIDVDLKSGENIQAWIDYDGLEKLLNISIVPVGMPKPAFPLLSVTLDLFSILEEHTYVGFSASTGVLSGEHYILAWSFNNNGVAQGLDLSRLPSIARRSPSFRSKRFIAGMCTAAVLLFLASFTARQIYKRRKKRQEQEILEEWELEYGPHRFSYKELSVATKKFHDSELVGVGGFGKVFRGVLPSNGMEVAVKRLFHDSDERLRDFLAELSIIGRLRHRNLVQLHGWSRGRGELLLVFEYMPNGSLDKMLYKNLRPTLEWTDRYKILSGIAAALLYLHEEWEQQVLHRDVKASNVLLDAEFNGKLGDFGLARLYEHGGNANTTRIVGTLGYLAPEFSRTGKATASTDVFSFGALMLEVATGRRPLETRKSEEQLILVDLVWNLYMNGRLLEAADPKLCDKYVVEELELVLQLGLLCSHPDPASRPTMRQVVQILAGDATIPAVPALVHPFDASKNVDFERLSSNVSSSLKSWSSYDASNTLSGR